MNHDPTSLPTITLTHEEVLELIDAWHEGELSPEESARVALHVQNCSRCQLVEDVFDQGLRQATTKTLPMKTSTLLPSIQRRIRLRSRGNFYGLKSNRSLWILLFLSIALLMLLMTAYLVLGYMRIR